MNKISHSTFSPSQFLILIFVMFSVQVIAQSYPITTINISLPANPDANTANWGSGNSLLVISASAIAAKGGVDAMVVESKILVTIKKAGVKVCGTYTSSSAPSSGFNTMTKVWSGTLAAGLLGQTCTLAPGDYELCVQFFGYKSMAMIPLCEEKIKAFTIKGAEQQTYQPPQAILPANGTAFSKADAKKPITFRWIPIVPRPKDPVTYRLKVWQLMQGQNGTQAMKSNQPFINKDVDNLTQAIIGSDLIPPCKPPYLCDFIWNVQAISREGKAIGENNGMSQAFTFNRTNDTTNIPHLKSMTTSACATTSTKHYTNGDIIYLSNDFIMTLTANPTGTNDSLSGKGTVKVKWLGTFNVKFSKIKINGNDALCAGTVYTNSDSTQVYPTQWAVNVANNNSFGAWNINKIKAVCSYIQGNKYAKPLVPATNQVTGIMATHPLNMPLGYFKKNDSLNPIGFTEMMFKPDHAEFEAIVSLHTKGIFDDASNNGTDAIGLQGKGIVFTNSGLHGINGSIKLVQPLTFLYANTGTESLKLTFNVEGSDHIGNGIVFNDTISDFWKYNLDANIQLPKEWLVPVDTAKTNVDLNFQMEIANWDDFILQANLPACTIPHSNGTGVEAGLITFDHSEISNVSSMVFPGGYTGDTTEMFTGFYLKNFKLTLPDQLRSYADTTKSIQVISENLIIDKDGITGKIHADNVLNYPKANIGNLGASIDTVKISISNSTLTEAIMLGKITLPLSTTDDISSAINYSALFTQSGSSAGNNQSSSITFALKPAQDITSKLLGDGKVQIDQTSTLNLVLSKSAGSKRNIQFNIDVNGKLSYPTGKIIDPGSIIPLDLDLSCNFEHLGMSYNKNAHETFSFNPGNWSFASPQKKLSGFSFTITSIAPRIDPVTTISEKQYLFKGGVEISAKINIGSENSKIGISGDTKIYLMGGIESSQYTAQGTPTPSTTPNAPLTFKGALSKIGTAAMNQSAVIKNPSSNLNVDIANAKKDYGFLTQLKPVYLGVKVESIHIDTHMAALVIKGNVEFYKHDAIYGNGFKGDLQAKFTTMSLAIQAGAIFGNTKYIPGNVGNGFKYWKVEAQVNLPPPGIVFMTGLTFRGFGAGVYSRMNITPPATFDPATANGSTFGGATFTPDFSVLMGLKIKAIIATTKEETFNGSVGLSGEFNSGGGLNFIQIDGLFKCGAKIIGEDNLAFANGAISVHYDFPNKIFDMNTSLLINKDPIFTPSAITTKFYIDGKNNKWYFKGGTPTNPMKVQVLGIPLDSYLMFGNDLGTDIPKAFMKDTKDGFASVGYNLPPYSESATGDQKYQSAKGFAFGMGINYKKSDTWNITSFHGYWCDCDRYLNITYKVAAGCEIDASLLQYSGCTGFGKGWRAKMSIAGYSGLILNYAYSLPVFGTSSGELFRMTAGLYGTAEFPNPTYLYVNYNQDIAFCGYNVGFHKEFQLGSKCSSPEVVDPSASQNVYQQENAGDSLSHNLISSIITPGSPTDISRITNFSALLNYPDNEPFDVQEQQSSGQMNVRTFRAVYLTTLTQDSVNHNPAIYNASINEKISTSTISNPTGNNKVSTTTNLVKLSGTTLKATEATSSPLGLVSAGYDALGARFYHLSATKFVTNALKANTSYKFIITGRLEEKVGSNWQPVKNKTNNVAIVQTKFFYFKTNSASVDQGVNHSNVNTGKSVPKNQSPVGTGK
jgi:hypothetical protein